jgi:hypothetical protein
MVYHHREPAFIERFFNAEFLKAVDDYGARAVLSEAEVYVADRYIAGAHVGSAMIG